jgi:hypothetical protein
LVAFIALTVAAYVVGALLLCLLFAGTARGGARAGGAPASVASLWNRFCASVSAQNESLRALNDSVHARHPDRAVDARRLELYTAAIVESERQTALLKAMRKAEFGGASMERPGPERPTHVETARVARR